DQGQKILVAPRHYLGGILRDRDLAATRSHRLAPRRISSQVADRGGQLLWTPRLNAPARLGRLYQVPDVAGSVGAHQDRPTARHDFIDLRGHRETRSAGSI